MYFPGERAADVPHAYRSWSLPLPQEMTAPIALRLPPVDIVPEPLRDELTVHVRIAYLGKPEEGARLVAPIRDLGPALIHTMAQMPYAEVGTIHAGPPVPLPVYEGSARLSGLPEAAVEAILRGLKRWTIAEGTLNCLSVRDTEPGSVREAFGKDMHDRLAMVKRGYDPANLFRVNHNIPPIR